MERLVKYTANGLAKYSITDFMDHIKNPSIPIPLLLDKLATTVCISLLVQGAIKNEAEFGVGIVSVIEILGFPVVIFFARSGPMLTKKSLNFDTIS